MLTILNIVLPVFALVGIGYGAVRFKRFPQSGVSGLIYFVNNFGAPCLMFQSMSNADFGTVFDVRLIGAFYTSAFIVMGIGGILAWRLFGSKPSRAVVAGFSASFSNLLLLGIPLSHRAFGEASLPVSYSIVALQAAILFTFAIVFIDIIESSSGSVGKTIIAAAMRVATNPLVVGIVLGLTVNLLGVSLPSVITDVVGMIASAVLPVALFGLGGALNEYSLRANWQQSVTMGALKLFLQPALAWIILVPLFGVPHEIARYVVILAAMPSGFNTYILATRTGQGEDIAANSILLTTAAAVFSASIWLYLLTL